MSKRKLRLYPEIFFSLAIITCMMSASFMISADVDKRKGVPVNDGRYWSVCYLDTFHNGAPYAWIHYQTFTFVEERPGYKLLIDTDGEKAGYWDSGIDIHGNHTIRIDLFDAVGASFISVEGTAVMEGHGKILIEYGDPYVFTKFLLVKEFRRQ